jgi:hypothetical protein
MGFQKRNAIFWLRKEHLKKLQKNRVVAERRKCCLFNEIKKKYEWVNRTHHVDFSCVHALLLPEKFLNSYFKKPNIHEI